jgi:hypothetical protein
LFWAITPFKPALCLSLHIRTLSLSGFFYFCFLFFIPLCPSFSTFCLYHRSSMPRLCPHPLALFSLYPFEENKRAECLISYPNNNHNVSTLFDGTLALDIGFHLRGNSSKTLAIIGRGFDIDIYVEGSGIARFQCSFEIDLDTGAVMLYDGSFANSTQVFGGNAMPFEHKRNEWRSRMRSLNLCLRPNIILGSRLSNSRSL